MSENSESQATRTYRTEFQCEHCGEWFSVEFGDPEETFEGTCSQCNAHYPELYV